MRILVIYGPNLNLLGVITRRAGTRLTLDKLTRALHRKAGELDVELKLYQFQSETDASKLIQRQRNQASGLMLVPGVWAQTGHLLRETIGIVGLPLAVVHLAPEQGPWRSHHDSVFKDIALMEETAVGGEDVAISLEGFVSRLAS